MAIKILHRKITIEPDGTIRNEKGQVLKTFPNCQTGYLTAYISTYKTNKKRLTTTVHKLVAQAYLGPRPPGLVINHKDGNITNNHFSNLEYVTKSEDMKHAFRIGLKKSHRGRKHTVAKYSVAKVARALALKGKTTISEASERTGISRTQIHRYWHGQCI